MSRSQGKRAGVEVSTDAGALEGSTEPSALEEVSTDASVLEETSTEPSALKEVSTDASAREDASRSSTEPCAAFLTTTRRRSRGQRSKVCPCHFF